MTKKVETVIALGPLDVSTLFRDNAISRSSRNISLAQKETAGYE